MTKKHSAGLITIIKDLIETQISKTIDVFRLAQLEAKLAVQTLVNMTFIIFIIILLIISSWILLNACVFLLLITFLTSSPLISSSILFACNFILLLVFVFYLYKIRENLFFPATRKQIFTSKKQKRDSNE